MSKAKEVARSHLLSSQVYKDGIGGIAVGGPHSLIEDPDMDLAFSQQTASNLLADVSGPQEFSYDGLIAQAIVTSESITGTRTRRNKLDQWKYAEGGDQSYNTLDTHALKSETTVKQLEASNVHFMMFKSGNSQIDCLRFKFANSTDYTTDPDGDPVEINANFFNRLKLSDWDGVAVEKLNVHAQRLEAIQHSLVYGIIPNREETHTQVLCEHFLGELVAALPGGDGYRVVSVAKMDAVEVMVEVSNTYLVAQGKPQMRGATGQQVALTAESDVAIVAGSFRETTKKDQFLNCIYHIEMKDAWKLKNSSTKAKSQLIAESLAKFLYRHGDGEDAPPNNICSVLFDGYSLSIMIHFTQEKTALLSHREIEPGRMVALLVWLHRLATSGKEYTLQSFREQFGDLVEVGAKLEDEMSECINKKRPTKAGGGSGGEPTQPTSKKRSAVQPIVKENAEFCLDLRASDLMEIEQERGEQLSMLSALRNYNLFGDPLPATKAMVQLLENQNDGNMSQYEDRLALVGMRED